MDGAIYIALDNDPLEHREGHISVCIGHRYMYVTWLEEHFQ